MPQSVLVDCDGTPVDVAAIEPFVAAFRGSVVRSGDAEYDRARTIWNASIDKRPGLIARCSGLADVIAAVRFAREHGLLVAVRGGGHNVGGRALCDGGMVIDLSRMKGIHVDPRERRARVQPGVLLGELDRETHVFGLAVPAGVVSKTGVAGLTLGGGVGWLARKHGLTCDNVVSFEVVSAEGEVLHVSADDHPDLFWALRGGGGNFGVVTSFEYRLHPVSMVLGGLVIHPRDQATELLKFYRSMTQSAPDELGTYAALMHTPDGHPVAAIATCYCGDLAEGERILAPLRAFGSPMVDAIQPMPFPVMQTLLDAAVPDGNQNYWKSTYVRELSDDAIDVIVSHADQATSPMTAVLVEQYGGAVSRVPASNTAFGQRHLEYDLGVCTQWSDAADSARHIEWTRNFADAMAPFRTGDYLLNFLGDEGEDTIRAAFGTNYERLVEVKRRYDPTNFFRVNQNVKPHPAPIAG
ncbi:6-hydroxy-D-nicotine oxidase [Luteitalea pratensis]|uniref:6-hydroxy-D-nicotine oxidase n=1 Tax=Luteitalea pratensis TaxID=1855912 RepID=A0A143PFI5_LUTPR|nr:FAD-binding oxidoreductase [Luteitalea pratensis]AMY07033.1 6-hydroxy-D-nicotine oxidase [Luteitalea pratensis]